MSDQENISRFCDITGASVETAQQFLEVNIPSPFLSLDRENILFKFPYLDC